MASAVVALNLKIISFTYNIKNYKEGRMRTRKRIREKEEKTKPLKKIILSPEDIIKEDYQAVLKLMQLASRVSKKRFWVAIIPENLSTESDREQKDKASPVKSHSSNSSSNLEENKSEHSGGCSPRIPNKFVVSEKNQSKTSLTKEKDLVGAQNELKSTIEGKLKRKRELKASKKVQRGLNDFRNLVLELNSSKIKGLLDKNSQEESDK